MTTDDTTGLLRHVRLRVSRPQPSAGPCRGGPLWPGPPPPGPRVRLVFLRGRCGSCTHAWGCRLPRVAWGAGMRKQKPRLPGAVTRFTRPFSCLSSQQTLKVGLESKANVSLEQKGLVSRSGQSQGHQGPDSQPTRQRGAMRGRPGRQESGTRAQAFRQGRDTQGQGQVPGQYQGHGRSNRKLSEGARLLRPMQVAPLDFEKNTT